MTLELRGPGDRCERPRGSADNRGVDMEDASPEEWRVVPHHPDYEASSFGRIRSYKKRTPNNPRLLKPFTDKLGYVRLMMDGSHVSVHQAVAAAWYGLPPDGMEVDHINSVRGDNRPVNLRYLTRQQNLVGRANAWVARCKNDHLMSGSNLLIQSTTGRRVCRACTRARARQLRERRASTPVPVDVHGTMIGYDWGCRCAICKAASSEYRRANRQRNAA